MTCPKTKQIQEVQITTAVDGSDKLLIVKSGINKSRSVTVDDFIHANSINTGELISNAVTSDKIADNAVVTNKLADDAVTGLKLADDTVSTTKLADDAVINSKIADSAVSGNKILDNTITASKIGPNAVGSSEIATGAVGLSEIASNSVDASKIIDGGVTFSKLNSNGVVTESEGIQNNDNDVTVPTSAAVKNYVDGSVQSIIYFTTTTTANEVSHGKATRPDLFQVTVDGIDITGFSKAYGTDGGRLHAVAKADTSKIYTTIIDAGGAGAEGSIAAVNRSLQTASKKYTALWFT